MKEAVDKHGGFVVPPDIALPLYRWFFLQKLSDLFNLGRVYWVDKTGIRVRVEQVKSGGLKT